MFGGGKGECNGIYGFCGTVFKLSRPKTKGGKWTEKVLHSFAGIRAGEKTGDGANPNGGLVLNSKGAIYGTTFAGGNRECEYAGYVGCGTAFELRREKGTSWTEKRLHVFLEKSDGGNPSSLISDAKGSLYGTLLFGGPKQWGTVFNLMFSKKLGRWSVTILYSFTDSSDGATPMAVPIFDSIGNLYVTTSAGSGVSRYGNVLKLTLHSRKSGRWMPSVLYGFANGVPDGAQPAASLVFDKLGNLYSTTAIGGNGSGCSFQGCGTVFRVKP